MHDAHAMLVELADLEIRFEIGFAAGLEPIGQGLVMLVAGRRDVSTLPVGHQQKFDCFEHGARRAHGSRMAPLAPLNKPSTT